MIWQRIISFFGIFVLLGIAWLFSNNKKKISFRVVGWGIFLQIFFAVIILKTGPGQAAFFYAKSAITRLLSFTDAGASFMFGNLYRANAGIVNEIQPTNINGHVMLLDSETTLSFGSTVIGEVDTLSIILHNPGSSALKINEVTFQDTAQFSLIANSVPLNISKKEKAAIKFLFSPQKLGQFTNKVNIYGENIADPTCVKILTEGVELAIPAIKVETDNLSLAQFKELGIIFAIHILPTIIFFASVMSILYHLGIMQKVVLAMAWVMSKFMGTSGAESLSAAGNIFVGQTEAPLLIKPYVGEMTQSELMAIMVGGFATIAGGVMAAYVRFGVDAGHLMAASVMSAPAALVVAKIMFPEMGESKTKGGVKFKVEKKTTNVVDAAASGAADGLRLAVNVGAMLMAFIALIAMLNFFVGKIDDVINVITFHHTNFAWDLSLKKIFGVIFAPLSFCMGVDSKDIINFGNLLGTKISINELVAYVELTNLKDTLSPRSYIIGTYALCGFANFSSIAIQIGGIGSIAPERRGDLAKIGIKAMIGGAIASWLTATIAGMLL